MCVCVRARALEPVEQESRWPAWNDENQDRKRWKVFITFSCCYSLMLISDNRNGDSSVLYLRWRGGESESWENNDQIGNDNNCPELVFLFIKLHSVSIVENRKKDNTPVFGHTQQFSIKIVLS